MKHAVLVFALVFLSSCKKNVPQGIAGTYSGTIEYSYQGVDSTYVDSTFVITISDIGENNVNISSTIFEFGDFSCHHANMWRAILMQSLTDPEFAGRIYSKTQLYWNDSLPDNSIYFDLRVEKD